MIFYIQYSQIRFQLFISKNHANDYLTVTINTNGLRKEGNS